MILIYLLLIIFGLGFLFVKRRYLYWADRKVSYLEPRFPFGNVSGFKATKHAAFVMQDHYNKLKGKGPFGGIYIFINPVVLATDLNFIKNIFVKDFPYFINRGTYHNEKDDPLSAHLFNIEDQRWKYLRAKLTPTFTSGKMKFMFPTIIAVAEEFRKCIEIDCKKNNGVIEMKEILARFTTDVIGTCAFGIDCNSLKDPAAKFREMGKKVFETPKSFRLKIIFMINYPNLARKLGMVTTQKDVSDFFMGAVRDTVAYREKNKIQRNDFIDLLIQLQKSEEGGLTVEEISAQAFVFFLAGFETSSTTMSYALYELSQNQEIQERARQEVNKILSKYDGKLTYEGMMELKYIEQIINESLRKYPPVANLFRRVRNDYTEPETGVILEKDTNVMVPIYGIQHDPEYYPDPETFDPERFTDEEVQNRNPYTFMPFGEGPRICIGLRFGMMQAKIGLATLLSNFKFTTCEKSIIPISFVPTTFILTSVGGLWLKAEKI